MILLQIKYLHRKTFLVLIMLLVTYISTASFILIPMDDVSQQNHLKAYGITFYSLQQGNNVKWLLNYRGGSFLLEDIPNYRNECKIRGVSYEVISDTEALQILEQIASPSQNMEAVILEKHLKLPCILLRTMFHGMMQ